MSDLLHSKFDQFVRADQPGALMNADDKGLMHYKQTKRKFAQLNTLDQLVSRIDQLEQRIAILESNSK